MEEPRIEELINIIEFQREALKFYADDGNYNPQNPLIMTDHGHQAKFALETSEKIEDYKKEMIELYQKEIELAKEQGEELNELDEDVLRVLNELKDKNKR